MFMACIIHEFAFLRSSSLIPYFMILKTRPAEKSDEDSEDGTNEILEDIEEALAIARLQGQIPPVRIARILAGEGTQQFSPDSPAESGKSQGEQTVPLSVALEYVGAILDESRKEITRLKVRVVFLGTSPKMSKAIAYISTKLSIRYHSPKWKNITNFATRWIAK